MNSHVKLNRFNQYHVRVIVMKNVPTLDICSPVRGAVTQCR